MAVEIRSFRFDEVTTTRSNIGTAPVTLNIVPSVFNSTGDVVIITATVDFRDSGPLRLFEFRRNGVVVATFRQFTREGVDSVLTLIKYLRQPASFSTYTLVTSGGSANDDIWQSSLSVEVLD